MQCVTCGAEIPDVGRFCPECGSSQPPTGALDAPTVSVPVGSVTPPAPPPSPPAAPPPGAAPAGWGADAPPPAGMPPTVPAPAASSSRGLPAAVKVLVVAVVVVVLGGVGWYFFQGSSSEGTGAASPDEAVQNIATSLTEDDLIGVLESLDPSEVGPLAEVADAALAKAGELELLQVTDTGLAELDLSVDDLELSVEELHPDVARVTIVSGSIGADFTSPDLGLALVGDDGATFVRSETSQGSATLDDLYAGENTPNETFVMTVKRDGGWYVSPLYTLAQFIVEGEDLDEADFEASRGDVEGADSPVAAAQAFADAIEGLDIEAGVAALPPGEWGFARDYLASALEGADMDELDETRDELGLEITDLELSEGVDLGDGRRQVDIGTVSFHYDDEYEGRTDVTSQDRCIESTNEEEDESSDTCLDEWMATDGEIDPILADLVPEQLFVVAVEVDGSWYVSPMETVAAYLRHAIDQLGDEHLAALGLVEPQPLTVGEAVEGELANPFRRNAYTFEVEDGASYLVTVTGPDLQFEADVHHVDGDSYGRATTDAQGGGGDIAQPGIFTAEGTQYAAVVGADTYDLPSSAAGDPAAFTLEIAEVDIAGEIELGEATELDLTEGETVVLEYESTGDEEVTFEVDGDAELSLFDPDGYSVFVAPGDLTSLYTEGTYLLVVTATDDGTVELLLDDGSTEPPEGGYIEPPTSLDGIPEIEIDTLETATVGDDELIDLIFVGNGGEVTVVAAGADDVFDPMMAVFDEDLELVAETLGDSTERQAELTIDTVEGALYVVTVTGFEGVGGDVDIRIHEG